MKVKHKYGVGAFSGTIAGATYCMNHNATYSIMREWVMPRLTSQNEAIGTVGTNLASVWADASSGWKNDLRTYTQRRFTEAYIPNQWDPNRSPYAYFTKMMYAWQASDPDHVDLATVTAADVDSLGSKIQTIKAAVENDMLPLISQIDDLTEVF